MEEEGYVYVHPFDDPDVIAGQGTVGMEIMNQHPGPPDVMFVPVGGGGLIAGIGAYVKYLAPSDHSRHRGRGGGLRLHDGGPGRRSAG